jgi:2'-5' RNA ligase
MKSSLLDHSFDMTYGSSRIQWRNFRTQVTMKRLVTGAFVFGIVFLVVLNDSITNKARSEALRRQSPFPQWNEQLLHDQAKPQRTVHFPFRDGCPHDCHEYRRDGALMTDEYYRVNLEWYLGEPEQYNPRTDWKLQKNSSSYSMGLNFQCPESFVRTFQKASRELGEKATKQLSTPDRTISIHPPKRMQLALTYLCCLDSEEASEAITAMDEWLTQRDLFDLEVRFDEIQSWHEAPNAVATVLVADQASQQALMRLNHELSRHLQRSDIPVAVPREDQMPFHVALAGFRHGGRAESYDPSLDITSQLPTVYKLVQKVSDKYKDVWTKADRKGKGEDMLRIQHNPRHSPRPILHTFPLIDKETW